VNALAVSHDGRLFASGSADNTVKIWRVDPCELLRTLAGHEADVFSITFCPNTNLLASAGYDSRIIIWNIETAEVQRVIDNQGKPVTSLAFSHDGTMLATAGRDSLIKVWDAVNWNLLRVLRGHTDYVLTLAFSMDGKWLASASQDGNVLIWDIHKNWTRRALRGHRGQVRSIAFDSDSQRIASAGEDGSVHVWRTETGLSIRTLAGFDGFNALAFSPDGKSLVAGGSDNSLKFWNVESWDLINSLPHPGWVIALAFARDGNSVFTASSDKSIARWDINSGKAVFRIGANSQKVMDVAFSPDGQWLASAHENGTVKLWDVVAGNCVANLPAHAATANSVAFSENGKLLASAGSDSLVAILDIERKQALRTIKKSGGAIHAIAFTPDGSQLASAGADKVIRIWDIRSGNLEKSLIGHGASINSLDFSPDGLLLVSASDDYTTKVWDVHGDSVLLNLKGHTLLVKSARFSPNGGRLATASSDNTVKIWDARTGSLFRTLGDHASSVRTAVFSPNEKFVASGGFDNIIRIWNVETGAWANTLIGHTNDVNALAYSPDGRLLASAGADGFIQIWDTDFAELKLRFVNLPNNEWLAYHPRKLIYNGSENAGNYAAVRFGDQVAPLGHFEKELKQKQVAEAIYLPQPTIKPETFSHNRAAKTKYWLGSAGLSLLGITLLFWLMRKPSDTTFDLLKRFFYAAGFKKLHQVDGDLFMLDSSNNEPSVLVHFCRSEKSLDLERLSKGIKQFRGKKNRSAKLYLLYRDSRELLKKLTLNGSLDCIAIPLHISSVIQPSYTSACRQKLREMEKPYLAMSDPYRDSEPIQDANWFFGRDELLHRLPNLLMARKHLALFGLPRVGKTSVLHQLRQVLKDTPSVLIDCQSYQLNADVFFEQILRQLLAHLSLLEVENLPGKSTLYGKPFSQSMEMLATAWHKTARRAPFVVMIDSVEQFFDGAVGKGNGNMVDEYCRFFATLKDVCDRNGDLVMIVAGRRADVNRQMQFGQNGRTNPLYQVLHEEFLGMLTARESSKLLREMGWRRSIKWRSEALDDVYRYCWGHPWITRCLASMASRQGELREIDLRAIENLSKQIRETWSENEFGEYFQKSLWPSLGQLEKEILQVVTLYGDRGLPKIQVDSRFSSAYSDVENMGLVGVDLGRISVLGDLLKFFLRQIAPTE
jgi:WD40 repeat protein